MLNSDLELMKSRMGLYNKYSNSNSDSSSVDGYNDRINQLGGYSQQDRMILEKKKSFHKALQSSYQAAKIIKENTSAEIPALINPNKLKIDYDEKVLSVDFSYGLKVGDIFQWKNTNTYWLIYLQDLTELAYFRGDIRKCSYKISYLVNSITYTTYGAIRGPVETTINSVQKHSITVDNPNYSLSIILPKTEQNLAYFKRYAKFYLNGDTTCWRVEAVDSYSSEGLIEINALEYYSNKDEDDVENGTVKGLIVENTESSDSSKIKGETFIKPKKFYKYTFEDNISGTWNFDKKFPIKYSLDYQSEYPAIYIKWDSGYSGQFELSFNDEIKTIVIQSLY